MRPRSPQPRRVRFNRRRGVPGDGPHGEDVTLAPLRRRGQVRVATVKPVGDCPWRHPTSARPRGQLVPRRELQRNPPEPDTLLSSARLLPGARDGRDAEQFTLAACNWLVKAKFSAFGNNHHHRRAGTARARLADATVDEAAACRRGLVLYHHNANNGAVRCLAVVTR